jgi:hypothetical protein
MVIWLGKRAKKERNNYKIDFSRSVPDQKLGEFDGSKMITSSSAGESHPYALKETDVILSIHPRLIDQLQLSSPFANERIVPARDAPLVPAMVLFITI